LSTSDINTNLNQQQNKQLHHAAWVYGLLTVFLYIFNLVYTSFSFGESSIYMHNMYLVTLIGGFIPFMLLLVLNKGHLITRLSFNLYNSGLACIVFGCLIKGIVNISGRCTTVERPYYYAAAAFILVSFMTTCNNVRKSIKSK
jgi:hypothetical protein